jgi:hypothetical protein
VNDRKKWAVFAAMLAVLGGAVAVVALAGGGDDDQGDARLTVERSFVPGTRQPELLVSVQRKLNVPDTAENGRTVGLVCTDGDGRKVIEARAEWPFLEEPNYPLPHTHQPASPKEIARVAQCEVTGTTVALKGRMHLQN